MAMRWIVRIGALLFVLWAAYVVSPYVAAWRLAVAVQQRDIEGIKARVNVRAVRTSLAKQIVAMYLLATGEGRASDLTARQLAAAAAEIADPLLAQLLSPEALLDLLDDGWPQSILSDAPAPAPEGNPAAPPTAAQDKPAGAGLGSGLSWRDMATMVDTRGFHKFALTVPGIAGPAARVRLTFHFDRWMWRVYEIEIPETLARRLAEELRKRLGHKP
jgi:hypothetical protein